jgi:dihydrofolate synthase/folylpolyglutamate synthase
MEASESILARFLALHPKLIDLSLDRIERLLGEIGSPQTCLPPVIHVGGTNGKGSTVAFMRAILEAAGRRVHVYTSPHLVRFHERIRLAAPGGGSYVSEAALVEAFTRCEAANAGKPITVFEITTAAALLLFCEHPADVLLMEVGLGGRFDSTNVISRPAAATVTPVSLDHAEFLGDSVAKIALEKAGIFKRGAPAVIAAMDAEPAGVLEDEARRIGARPIIGGQDFLAREENGRFVYEDEAGLMDLPLPRLDGRHQLTNAATAIASLRAAGLAGLEPAAFEAGMRHVDWPARLQRLGRGALAEQIPAGSELWLDGSHNQDGGKVTAAALAELGERRDRPLVLIVGMLATKDAAAFLRSFAGLARDVFTVTIPGQVAARPAIETAEIARQVGLRAEPVSGIAEALQRIAMLKFEAPPRILITGSLYLAGEVLAQNGTPPT